MLFSWASRGRLTEYIYDNNSATAARDELAHTLRLLFASNAEQVNIIAHSMGNWVTVEALRQLQIAGQLPHSSKVGSIFLAAPDIDLDVFKSQLRAFPPPRKPFYVVLSRDDQALRTSSFLAGGKDRLGDASHDDELAALGATVIDLTNVKADNSMNHGKFAELRDDCASIAACPGKRRWFSALDRRSAISARDPRSVCSNSRRSLTFP